MNSHFTYTIEWKFFLLKYSFELFKGRRFFIRLEFYLFEWLFSRSLTTKKRSQVLYIVVNYILDTWKVLWIYIFRYGNFYIFDLWRALIFLQRFNCVTHSVYSISLFNWSIVTKSIFYEVPFQNSPDMNEYSMFYKVRYWPALFSNFESLVFCGCFKQSWYIITNIMIFSF